jgi:hypothetical protein
MNPGSAPTFVTLGPTGTNHELVTRNYLAFRGLEAANLVLVERFRTGLELMSNGRADFMVQVAVHPDCAQIVATAHFEFGIRVVDTFISPSKPLAILTRKTVNAPTSLGLQPATSDYADLSPWPDHVYERSIMQVAEGLLQGRYDSGLTSIELADQYPDLLQVDVAIGTVDDPWIVFGKQSVTRTGLIAWPGAPVTAELADTARGRRD